MMDSQRQSGSFSEFGRSTSPTLSEPEGEVAQPRKVAAVSTVSYFIKLRYVLITVEPF